MSHVYCPECGFQNPEAANYCAKCGALLVLDSGSETTMAYTLDEGEEDAAEALEDLGSLNGTFLNRHRIESGQLNDGDELQIGKYRLMFLLK